jgi:hypothetical protein
MSEVTARKPTRKAFYFPKSPDEATPEGNEVTPAKAAKGSKARSAAKSATTTGTSKSSRAKTKSNAKSAAKSGTKSNVKSATKADAKSNAKPSTKASAPAPAVEAEKKPAGNAVAKGKEKRAKKEKVVRDSFTMPKADYDRIATLKQRCLEAGVSVKKSELLRAGLQLLEASSAQRLAAAIAALETVKTGRPAKDE